MSEQGADKAGITVTDDISAAVAFAMCISEENKSKTPIAPTVGVLCFLTLDKAREKLWVGRCFPCEEV